MSTRPDYIDEKILDNLKEYEVDIIELGVQSFDPEVLRRSNRGHTAEVVYKSAELIKSYGFTLGIQLMVGLPGDSFDKCMYSVAETIKIGPSIARIYPTVVLADTELLRMAELGTYTPLSESEAVATAKEMYKALTGAGINVIRVGLKSTDVINAGSAAIGAGGYHPAFRQLVEGEIAKESLEAQLTDLLAAHAAGAGDSDFLTAGVDASSLLIHGAGDSDFPAAGADASASLTTDGPLKVTFSCHPSSFSNMIGNCKANKIYFTEKYPALSIRFAADKDIEPGSYKCSF